MRTINFILFSALLLTGCSQRYYIVRHAEKGTSETRPSDPPLSPEGIKRAEALQALLKDAGIRKIYATPTQRAFLTAQPLSEALGIKTEAYGPLPDQKFLEQLKAQKTNMLIVGHSNTVDDIVNGLVGSRQVEDLQDHVYGNIYIIRKRGKRTRLTMRTY